MCESIPLGVQALLSARTKSQLAQPSNSITLSMCYMCHISLFVWTAVGRWPRGRLHSKEPFTCMVRLSDLFGKKEIWGNIKGPVIHNMHEDGTLQLGQSVFSQKVRRGDSPATGTLMQ